MHFLFTVPVYRLFSCDMLSMGERPAYQLRLAERPACQTAAYDSRNFKLQSRRMHFLFTVPVYHLFSCNMLSMGERPACQLR